MDPFGASGNTIAAWMQAVGSVLAIGAAVALSWWQHTEARRSAVRQRWLDRNERIDGLGGLMEDVYSEIYKAHCAAYTGDWRRYVAVDANPSRLKRAAEALERAPLHEAGNWRIVKAAIAVREVGFAAANTLEYAKNLERHLPSDSTDYVEGEIERLFDEANKAMAPVVRALAYDYFEVAPLSEWKEHLDMPEEFIPKHLRPPSAKKVNSALRRDWRRQRARNRKERI